MSSKSREKHEDGKKLNRRDKKKNKIKSKSNFSGWKTVSEIRNMLMRLKVNWTLQGKKDT